MNTKNIFDRIPESFDSEIVDKLIETDQVRVERIISRGHASPEAYWYDQAQNEWVMVLRGEAVILFADQSTIRLSAGDYTTIAAHVKHRVQWTDPDRETVWLAVHY